MKKVLFLALLAVIAAGTIHYVKAQKATPSLHFTNATVTLVNNAGACCYRAVFIQGSETSYQFKNTYGTVSFPSVLAPGTYTLGVAPIGGSSTSRSFSWSIGPDGGSQTGTSATFYNVNVTSGSTITVTIN
jgi:hypothetical protein